MARLDPGPFAADCIKLLSMALLACPLLAVPVAASGRCWQRPQAQTLEELAKVAENQQRRAALSSGAGVVPASARLALSAGPHMSAYAAGLLVGWGETSKRPDFSIVTAAGVSALIAPFAFIGADGDQKIADVFSCEAASLSDMAERAASFIDRETLEKIARRHEAGARLMVALPGSAARKETVWDIGAIAAGRDPKSPRYIANILLAAVDLTTFIDPATIPMNVGSTIGRNATFRQIGAGEPFLAVEGRAAQPAASYLIHNGVLFPDEGEAYAAMRSGAGGAPLPRAHVAVVSAYDFFMNAQATRAQTYIASPRPHLNIRRAEGFDMSYYRALFLHAYRQGRMGREWRDTFPDEDGSRYYGAR
ncbi:MAG: hypothetical protein Q8L61_01790 [Hyphomicrobium sp.]|nr:hypothetical protein [Hyphomicrobium sp.]